MKRVVLLLSAIILTIGVNAQKGKVNSAISFVEQGALDKAKENIDAALKHEKSKDWTKTYYALGRLAMASYESENPKFKGMFKSPLVEAYQAYEKAIQLDPKDATKKLLQINSTYTLLGNMFINQGVQYWQNQNFTSALESFEYNIKISESDVYIGMVDTGIIYNAGLAAYNAKMYDKAIKYFEICTESNYETTSPHQLMYLSYIGLEDLESAETVLNRAYEKFPGNQEVLLLLIQHYLDNDLTDKGLRSVEVALEKDPENPSLHLAHGVFYMKLEQYNKALTGLEKSAELKPDDFATQLNLGICYYNVAFERYLESNEILDVKKYNEAVAEVNKMFAKALAPFEKAHELNPEDIDTMKNLKELYYRLQMVEKYEAISKKLEGKI
ncbi:MAG: tetratricopeptide repeat protein [Bacteroidales bacterium]|jgi:tetratricopeptide (TPR) repeat protein|nr:tetratricopeptide repeat protein [Bacteroidales bacterium]